MSIVSEASDVIDEKGRHAARRSCLEIAVTAKVLVVGSTTVVSS